jgi:hypothetical protein
LSALSCSFALSEKPNSKIIAPEKICLGF